MRAFAPFHVCLQPLPASVSSSLTPLSLTGSLCEIACCPLIVDWQTRQAQAQAMHTVVQAHIHIQDQERLPLRFLNRALQVAEVRAVRSALTAFEME